VIRRYNVIAPLAALALSLSVAQTLRAQTNPGTPAQPAQTPSARTLGTAKKEDIPRDQKPAQPKFDKSGQTVSAEQIAELVILFTGSRQTLQQIRHNGVEHGQMTRVTIDGRTEEGTYDQRFVHGENAAKDKIRLDQKTPATEYALIYSEGQVWGLINGTAFTPRQEATANFLAQTHHSLDALLRYKENGSTLTYVNKDKQKNIDMWIIDLTDKDKYTTRYYISAKTGHVLALEYEETPPGADKPIKYRRTFHDYRVAQNTLVPYRTVLYQDDKQIEETRLLTVTYGVRMDDSYFQNPQTATTSSQP
jgi:hypothetical protein